MPLNEQKYLERAASKPPQSDKLDTSLLSAIDRARPTSSSEMESSFVGDLPLWDEKYNRVFYQLVGEEGREHPYYKPGDKELRRHERVIKITDIPGQEELEVEEVTPSHSGLIPLMPTGPKDLIAETLFSAIGETYGAGTELGVALGLGAGMRGGKYLVGGVDQMIKGAKKTDELLAKGVKKGTNWADEVLGHEYTKHQYQKAFSKMKEDPMLAHIPFKKVSKFERPSAPKSAFTEDDGMNYAAYYHSGVGGEMQEEIFPRIVGGEKSYYKQIGEGGYEPSFATEWRGHDVGENPLDWVGDVSGEHTPFVIKTDKLSSWLPRKSWDGTWMKPHLKRETSSSPGYASSTTVHEGTHHMQSYPETPTAKFHMWESKIGGRTLDEAVDVVMQSEGGGTTLIQYPVPKKISELPEKSPLPQNKSWGRKTGFMWIDDYDYVPSKEPGVIKKEIEKVHGMVDVDYDPTPGYKWSPTGKRHVGWQSSGGPKEVEARISELYSAGGGHSLSALRRLGYNDMEIKNMLEEYTQARAKAYGPSPSAHTFEEVLESHKKQFIEPFSLFSKKTKKSPFQDIPATDDTFDKAWNEISELQREISEYWIPTRKK